MLESLSQKILSEQPGQGSHPGEIAVAHTPQAPGLSAELAVVLCQQDFAAVTAALFQWELCLSQSSISRCSLTPGSASLPKCQLM